MPASNAGRVESASRTATAPISRQPLSSAPLDAPQISSSSVDQPNVPRAGADGSLMVQAEPGDTAYSLSRRYGVSARAIMAANNLTNAEDVRAGQAVRIPRGDDNDVSSGNSGGYGNPRVITAPRPQAERRAAPEPAPRASAAPVPAPTQRQAAAPSTPRTDAYVVRSGDTLYSIARRYDLTAGDIARHNDMRTNDVLRVGARLDIPADGAVRTASLNTSMTDAPRPSEPAVKPVTAPARNSLAPLPAPTSDQGNNDARTAGNSNSDEAGKTDRAVAGAPEPKRVKTAAITPTQQTDVPASTGKLPDPPSLTGANFRWPVRGRLISGFGQKPQGTQNDGINIAVPEGTSVKAAENGVVAYVGNELKGFGNLVLIRHDGDWVTAYAHNSQILVRRGDRISRGQIIAKAGKTGSVGQPQLHFELRKGSRPVDPMPHLAQND